MFSISRKMIADEDAVQDIIQEIFVSYFQKTKKQNMVTNPQAWLLRATINKSIDFLERKKKHSDLSSIKNMQYEDKNIIEENQKQMMLRKALNMLSPNEMKIAILYSESFSYKEISELSGINFNNIGKTLSRTLQKLKTILKDMNYDLY